MECGHVSVASLAADYVRDLAELEAIRGDIVAAQDRVARLAAALTARRDTIIALAPATTATTDTGQRQSASATLVVEAVNDEPLIARAPVISATADETLMAGTGVAVDVPVAVNEIAHCNVAATPPAATKDVGTTATAIGHDGSTDDAEGSQLKNDASASLLIDQQASEVPNTKTVEATPLVSIEVLVSEPPHTAALPALSTPPAEPLRRARMPEGITADPVPSTQTAQDHADLQPVILAQSSPNDAVPARLAPEIEPGTPADTLDCKTDVPPEAALDDGPTVRSNVATSTTQAEAANVDLPIPQLVLAAPVGAAGEPTELEVVASAVAHPSVAAQPPSDLEDVASNPAAIGTPLCVTADAVSTLTAAADKNVVTLDAARPKAPELVRPKDRRRVSIAALVSTAAAISAFIVAAQIYDPAVHLQIEQNMDLFTAGSPL